VELANFYGWLTVYSGPIILGLSALVVVLIGLSIWSVIRMHGLEKRYRMLTMGTNGKSLEGVLEGHIAQVREVSGQGRELSAQVRELQRLNCFHIQHLGFLRFNPFRETGGDQSFVLALTDGNGDGAVVSTLHSRDVTRVYGKPLRQWQSTYPLTDEELQVIRQAKSDV
jgi:hypothetical protein